ncbi:uncharacterized protein UTRI_10692 [Ustilago trichophora]|uniref:Effector family protein Eff1 n=1 Tax=Ustilago trichophora TaxID=86804 RepID=A0A5C3E8N2_9BASI|nr:uncharacterized protein UTRI_10692 [Ustilago trichophora]
MQNSLLLGKDFAIILVAFACLGIRVYSQPPGDDLPSPGSPARYGHALSSPSTPGFHWQEYHSFDGWSPELRPPTPLQDHVAVQAHDIAAETRTVPRSDDELSNHASAISHQHPIRESQTDPVYPAKATMPDRESQPVAPPVAPVRTASRRRTRKAPKLPKAPRKPRGPVQFRAMLQTEDTVEEWRDSMRRALGNPNLEFTSLPDEFSPVSRLLVAKDPASQDDHHPVTASLQEQPPKIEGKQHFARRLEGLEKVYTKYLNIGPGQTRSFIYFNSRSNMNYLNNQYFLNRLHFLPINPQELRWRELNRLFYQRDQFVGLPPRTIHGLPVLLAQHREGTPMMRSIEKFTGELKHQTQVVSLWSPVLHTKGRTTAVLYGVAQMDRSDTVPAQYILSDTRTLMYLNRLETERENKNKWDGAYYLKDDFPGGFPADLAEKGLKISELGIK